MNLKDISLRLTNVSLRAATLFSKFAMILVLAKVLPPEDVGLYGLFAATTAYLLMVLGLDFYTFANREIVSVEKYLWAKLIRDQAILYLVIYLILLPFCLLIFELDFLPWNLAIWFFPILALEHVAQEINRILVSISEPLWASFVLFVRAGLWSFAVVLVFWIDASMANLDFLFAFWLFGLVLACLIGISRLKSFDLESISQPVNWSWIKLGVKAAIPFFIATLCLRAIYTVDRYWVESLGNLEILGAYVLYMGMATAIFSFLDSAVFTFAYPSLIKAANEKQTLVFKALMRKLWIQTGLVLIVLSLSAGVVSIYLFDWIGRPVYSENDHVFYVSMLTSVIFGLSMVPHYGLYAHKQDKPIILSHVFGLCVFLILLLSFGGLFGVVAVPFAMSLSFFCMFIFKFISFRRFAGVNKFFLANQNSTKN